MVKFMLRYSATKRAIVRSRARRVCQIFVLCYSATQPAIVQPRLQQYTVQPEI